MGTGEGVNLNFCGNREPPLARLQSPTFSSKFVNDYGVASAHHFRHISLKAASIDRAYAVGSQSGEAATR